MQSTSGSGLQLEGKVVAPCRRLRPVPKDGIIGVVIQVDGLSGYFRTIDLLVRCRTLLGLADDVPKPKPEPEHEPEAGGNGPAAVERAARSASCCRCASRCGTTIRRACGMHWRGRAARLGGRSCWSAGAWWRS